MGKLIRRSNVRPRSEYGVRGTTAQLEVLSTQNRVRRTSDGRVLPTSAPYEIPLSSNVSVRP